MSDHDCNLTAIMDAAQKQGISLVVEQGHEIVKNYLEGRDPEEAVKNYAELYDLSQS